MRLFRNALSGLLLCTGLMTPSTGNAITVVSSTPLNPEFLLPGTFTNYTDVRCLNADMQQVIQGTSETRLTAVVVEGDRRSFGAEASLLLNTYGLNAWTIPVNITLPTGATNPDVSIANVVIPPYNMDHDFMVTVVYELAGDIILDAWLVENVGLSTTSFITPFTLATTLNAPGSICRNPHIDMSIDANFNTYSGAHYPLRHYAIVWEQGPMVGSSSGIYGVVGFLNSSGGTPTFFNSSPTVIAAGDYSYPDVACQGYITIPPNPMDPSRMIYVSYIDNANNDVLMTQFEAEKTIVITSGMTTTTIAQGTAAGKINSSPRIECIVAGDLPGFAQQIWQIVCETDHLTGFKEINVFTNMGSPLTPVDVYNFGLLFPWIGNHVKPVVSGVGEGCYRSSTAINSHNKYFTTSYFSTYTHSGTNGLGAGSGDYFANTIYQATGYPAPLGSYPDYYEINDDVLEASFLTPAVQPIIATTSSSNTGYELFSVWFDGDDGTNGELRCKFNSDTYSYKNGTTGVAHVNKEKDYNIYPSPATTTLHVQGADNTAYRIVDAIGKTVASGTVTAGANTIAVNQLAAGTYLISLTENGYTQQARFVKQ